MSDFKVNDYIVRVKAFDTKDILKIVSTGGGMVECNDGLFYSTKIEWTRHATEAEIKAGRRLCVNG